MAVSGDDAGVRCARRPINGVMDGDEKKSEKDTFPYCEDKANRWVWLWQAGTQEKTYGQSLGFRYWVDASKEFV